jgi:hypothetical protein
MTPTHLDRGQPVAVLIRPNLTPKEKPMPQRIQRRRTKGWRKPDNCVIVTRPSRFGNPFTIAGALEAEIADNVEDARAACARWFRHWLNGELYGGYGPEGTNWSAEAAERIRAGLPELRGKDLACYCPLPAEGEPDHCHAAALLSIANQETR